MAHPICGIDVGAFSIKFVVFEVGFRHTLFRGAFEEMVNDGPEPLLARQVAALREGLGRVSSEATLYLALPGDQLSIPRCPTPVSGTNGKIGPTKGVSAPISSYHPAGGSVASFRTPPSRWRTEGTERNSGKSV